MATTTAEQPIFYQYNTPEEKANAFRRMIHAREEWREQVRQAKLKKSSLKMLITLPVC